MEQVFDFREFFLKLLHKCKIIIVLAVLFGILGGCYGIFLAGQAAGGEDTFTATSAATVNIDNPSDKIQWTPASIMTTVDSTVGSDFVYANFADELTENGLEQVLGGKADPTVADMKLIAKFYTKGNLLFADITTPDQELSRKASEVAITYLAQSVPAFLNHVTVVPQDKQTINVVTQVAPSKTQKALKFGVLGGAAGVVLGFLWIFFFDVFDLKVRSDEDLRKFGIPVLGVLPKGSGNGGKGGKSK